MCNWAQPAGHHPWSPFELAGINYKADETRMQEKYKSSNCFELPGLTKTLNPPEFPCTAQSRCFKVGILQWEISPLKMLQLLSPKEPLLVIVSLSNSFAALPLISCSPHCQWNKQWLLSSIMLFTSFFHVPFSGWHHSEATPALSSVSSSNEATEPFLPVLQWGTCSNGAVHRCIPLYWAACSTTPIVQISSRHGCRWAQFLWSNTRQAGKWVSSAATCSWAACDSIWLLSTGKSSFLCSFIFKLVSALFQLHFLLIDSVFLHFKWKIIIKCSMYPTEQKKAFRSKMDWKSV